MQPGGVTTQAPGATQDFFRFFKCERVGGRSVQATFAIIPGLEGRFVGLLIGGVLQRPLEWIGDCGVHAISRLVDTGDTFASVYLEDYGLWDDVEDVYSHQGAARENDSLSAQRLSFLWRAPSTFSIANGYVSNPRGDSQLSAIVVTGMQRFTNVEAVPDEPTRGQLTYSIVTNSAGDYVVTWFAANKIVAIGTRTGNGAVICAEEDSSGLAITCTITYSADIAPNTAYIQLMWPETYQVHYKTGTLSFPHTADLIVVDLGADGFTAISPVLTPGTYQAAVVPVRDGIAQSSGITVVTGLVVKSMPLAPTITSVTGTAAAATVHWTDGEAGDTYKVYYGKIGEPINFGNYATPAPITTGVDATSQVLGALTGYPGLMRVVVRATKSGVEEQNGNEYTVEFDSTGAIVAVRPNRASITKASQDGLILTVTGLVLSHATREAAVEIDLFIALVGVALDFASPAQASVFLSDAVAGVQTGVIEYTAPAEGNYHYAIRARGANDSISVAYSERNIWLTEDVPTEGISGLNVQVIRSLQG